MYVPSFAILSHHFKRRRTTMMSIVSSGVALGGIANTIMLNKLFNGPIGFKMGVRISASFISVLLFLSCILMRTRYSAVRPEASSINFWKATRKCFTEIPSLLTIIGWLFLDFFLGVVMPISYPRFTLFQVAYLYPFFYFQVDSLKHGLSDSFAFYSVGRHFMHCEAIALTVDHIAGRYQCGKFHWSVRGWCRDPLRRGRQPHDHHDCRMRYLDHWHDLAWLGGECGSTRGVVRFFFGNEYVLCLCAPTWATFGS